MSIASITATAADGRLETADPPHELVTLRDRILKLPPSIRQELEPVVSEALEEARFRDRVLSIAREALVRLRLDLEIARFDLDVTRRERENLRRILEEE